METRKHNIKLQLSMLLLVLTIVLSFSSIPLKAQSVIPQPQSIKMTGGQFIINENTKLYMNMKRKDKRMMRKYLETLPYKFLSGKEKSKENVIKLLLVPEKKDSKDKKNCETCKQKYTLSITPLQVVINASDAAGLFYGLQSMLQLTSRTSATTYQVKCAESLDTPRFE